jgi:uncharacterized LabA/DUF88 family protein
MADRAVVFIDGNNWFHSLRSAGVERRLESTDPRISISLGRIEPRSSTNEAARELREYLAGLTTKIDPIVFAALSDIAKRHGEATVFVEKAVDVFLAVDLVTMAINDVYDAAYLLTADGDYTPAVAEVRNLGKKVYAASPVSGAQLAKAVNSFIHIRSDWFDDCYQ